MPSPDLPFLISGKVIFAGTNIAVEGATVSLTYDSINYSETTNSKGEYLINIPGTIGDSVTITVTLQNRTKSETITLQKGGQTVNFEIEISSSPSYQRILENIGTLSNANIVDKDTFFTRDSKGRPIKIIEDFGFFKKTTYLKYGQFGESAINVVITYED